MKTSYEARGNKMTEDKKDRRKEKIQKILKRAAPVILSVSGSLIWSPVYTRSAEIT